MGKRNENKKANKKKEKLEKGIKIVSSHPMFSNLMEEIRFDQLELESGWAKVDNHGYIYLNKNQNGTPEEWAYILAHCLLHLGLNHFIKKEDPINWNIACDCYIAKFLADFKFGMFPQKMYNINHITSLPINSEEKIYNYLMINGIPENMLGFGTCDMIRDMIIDTKKQRYYYSQPIKWEELFAIGLSESVTSAVNVAAGYEKSLGTNKSRLTNAEKAKNWFINSYPLLGALASTFELIEDTAICNRMNITVAAVSEITKEIYINPAANLNNNECKFVIAHELLHVGLRHASRCQGRFHYYWNIACDYVINAWLIEMAIGETPRFGVLYDSKLKDLSAESIYDIIVSDLRKYRKIASLRGIGLGDILDENVSSKDTNNKVVNLDKFYKNCISEGLTYHQEAGRDYIPSGLIEEIRALGQPPIPWDIELARWFDGYFAPIEKVRTYARVSRRQASTPDIPRPSYVNAGGSEDGRTFGVVLDTSGSMDRTLLAKALGAIASYSISREVPFIRVVFCDAVAYDEGYISPEAIGEKFKVRGRGGTILQPGIDLLEQAKDFPKKGPILIITDGDCDKLSIRRDHAFLVPQGAHLPFIPKGKVFRFK